MKWSFAELQHLVLPALLWIWEGKVPIPPSLQTWTVVIWTVTNDHNESPMFFLWVLGLNGFKMFWGVLEKQLINHWCFLSHLLKAKTICLFMGQVSMLELGWQPSTSGGLNWRLWSSENSPSTHTPWQRSWRPAVSQTGDDFMALETNRLVLHVCLGPVSPISEPISIIRCFLNSLFSNPLDSDLKLQDLNWCANTFIFLCRLWQAASRADCFCFGHPHHGQHGHRLQRYGDQSPPGGTSRLTCALFRQLRWGFCKNKPSSLSAGSYFIIVKCLLKTGIKR